MSDLPLKIVKTDPKLQDLLDGFSRDIMLRLNCHAIGQIQSFNSAKQTVQVQISYGKTIAVQQSDGTYTQQLVNYAPLIDVPVISLCGGTAGLTMPIVAGDNCLLLFNDRDIDNWVGGASSGAVATGRLHSTSDALALVGLNKVSTYNTAHAMLYNGTTQVGVSSSKVLITNSAGKTLNTLLQNLCTQVENLATACAAIMVSTSTGGPPTNAVTISAVTTQVTTIATQIGALLE